MRCFSRFAALALSLILLTVSIPLSTTALSSGDFTYETANDNTAITITGYTGSDTSIVIPETINGLPVTKIGNNAFSGLSSITAVTFPKNLQTIGTNAFYNCTSLSDINISNYTFNIGFEAFHGTSWYTNAEDGPLYLGRVLYTYIGTMTETTFTVKDYTAAIAPYALAHRTELKTIYLPVGLRYINKYAFLGCSSLSDIRIPPSVISIGSNAFYGAESVTIHSTTDSAANQYATDNELHFSYDATLDYLDGDMNKDGKVDSSDCRLLLRVLMATYDDCDHERFLSSDFLYDGKIDTADLRKMMINTISI